MSIAMIVGFKESKKPKKDIEQFLKKMTHLHLEDKKLEILGNLDKCENLSHLYLHDNIIYTLVNDPFPNLKKLVQLSLYQNRIDKMEGMMDLVSLKKLYIEKNCISKLDGLDNCRELEELYIGNQDLPAGTEFTFDEYSLAAISSTLKVLDIPNTQVVNPKPLYYLEGLETLNMKENLIEDFEN